MTGTCCCLARATIGAADAASTGSSTSTLAPLRERGLGLLLLLGGSWSALE